MAWDYIPLILVFSAGFVDTVCRDVIWPRRLAMSGL